MRRSAGENRTELGARPQHGESYGKGRIRCMHFGSLGGRSTARLKYISNLRIISETYTVPSRMRQRSTSGMLNAC